MSCGRPKLRSALLYRIQPLTRFCSQLVTYSCFMHVVVSRVGCRDESKYCNLIPALHMCRYPQYRHRCCQSCSRHAIAPAPFRSAHRYVAWCRSCDDVQSSSRRRQMVLRKARHRTAAAAATTVCVQLITAKLPSQCQQMLLSTIIHPQRFVRIILSMTDRMQTCCWSAQALHS